MKYLYNSRLVLHSYYIDFIKQDPYVYKLFYLIFFFQKGWTQLVLFWLYPTGLIKLFVKSVILIIVNDQSLMVRYEMISSSLVRLKFLPDKFILLIVIIFDCNDNAENIEFRICKISSDVRIENLAYSVLAILSLVPSDIKVIYNVCSTPRYTQTQAERSGGSKNRTFSASVTRSDQYYIGLASLKI